MTRKKIIISIIIVIVITVGTVAALYFFKLLAPSNTDEVTAVPDLAEDYGACDLLTTESIKDALGTPANSLKDGFDTGRIRASSDSQAQSCVYGLTDQVTAITETMLLDSFYTTVYLYGNEANKTDADSFYDDAEMVDGIGEQAGFSIKTDDEATYTDYELRVNSDLRYFSFSIRTSPDSTLFTESSAQEALTSLAKLVDYSAFKNTK